MTCWCSLNEGSDCLFLEFNEPRCGEFVHTFSDNVAKHQGHSSNQRCWKNTHKQRDVIIQFHLLHNCVFNTLNQFGCCRRWKNKEEKVHHIWPCNTHKLSLVFFELYFLASFRCELLFIKCLIHHHCDCCAFIKQTVFQTCIYVSLLNYFNKVIQADLKFSSQVSIVKLHTGQKGKQHFALHSDMQHWVYQSNLWHSRGAPVCLYIMYT